MGLDWIVLSGVDWIIVFFLILNGEFHCSCEAYFFKAAIRKRKL